MSLILFGKNDSALFTEVSFSLLQSIELPERIELRLGFVEPGEDYFYQRYIEAFSSPDHC